jgi:hypothetical protein
MHPRICADADDGPSHVDALPSSWHLGNRLHIVATYTLSSPSRAPNCGYIFSPPFYILCTRGALKSRKGYFLHLEGRSLQEGRIVNPVGGYAWYSHAPPW